MRCKQTGSNLFNLNIGDFTGILRRFLTLAMTPDASTYTLNAFRAGRATELAVQGEPLGAILSAGEWKSAQFLRYVDVDIVEQQLLFVITLESDSGG